MGVKNLLADIGESIIGLGRGLFSKKERKCPHMGCRLEWNSEEERWELKLTLSSITENAFSFIPVNSVSVRQKCKGILAQ